MTDGTPAAATEEDLRSFMAAVIAILRDLYLLQVEKGLLTRQEAVQRVDERLAELVPAGPPPAAAVFLTHLRTALAHPGMTPADLARSAPAGEA